MIKIKKALISVYDKKGIVEFAKKLSKNNVIIISTGGTAKYLKENGISIVSVEDVTGYPEILGGRVKTLHPSIHGGILFRRDREDDMKEIEKMGISPIDMVVVNFYPFEEWSKRDISMEDLLEYIDIGGPTMIRAAAKNFPYVVPVVSPRHYDLIVEEIEKNGGVEIETSKRLAFYAFSETAKYDGFISNYLAPEEESFKEKLFFGYEFKEILRYGENPHQRGAFYKDVTKEEGFSVLTQLGGKKLSYNNYQDMEAAWKAVSVFTEPASVIVKHMNPCGVSLNKNILEAYREALASDPVSAFGGIVAFNRLVDKHVAEEIVKEFREVVMAPDFTQDAISIFEKKPNLRVIKLPLYSYKSGKKEYRGIWGGILVQDEDLPIRDLSSWKVMVGEVNSKELWEEIAFSFQVVGLCKSNAIVISKGKRTVGIGMGLPSRIDAAEVAIKKAKDKTKGAILASDAFFPFPDVIELAASFGIKVIIEPGGSKRDNEVIEAAKKHKITLIFTGERHFRH